MEPQQPKYDPHSDLVGLLGLASLRCGTHPKKDWRIWRKDEVYVSRLWSVLMRPSNNKFTLIGAATFEENTVRGKTQPAYIKAAVVSFDPDSKKASSKKAAELETDPLPNTVKAVNLMPEGQTAMLGGCVYDLRIFGDEMSVVIQFHTPNNPTFAAIRAAFLSVRDQVIKANA